MEDYIDVEHNNRRVKLLNKELEKVLSRLMSLKQKYEEEISKIQAQKKALLKENQYAYGNYSIVFCIECMWFFGKCDDRCGCGLLVTSNPKPCAHYYAIKDFSSVRVCHYFTTSLDLYRLCAYKNNRSIVLWEEDRLLREKTFNKFDLIKSELKKLGWIEKSAPLCDINPYFPIHYPREIMINPRNLEERKDQ